MITYDELVKMLDLKFPGRVRQRREYSVIVFPKSEYHLTIFRDQWDDYQKITGHPYYLFHISSNNVENRCSIYWWVDKKNLRIHRIPDNIFKYSQPNYSIIASTRQPCRTIDIAFILKFFGKFLRGINNVHQ